MDVEHVKKRAAPRRKCSKCRSSKSSSLKTNETTDELAREGAMMDGGVMAQVRASTVQQEREDVCAALQYAASLHCLVEGWRDGEELKPKPKEKWTLVNKKGEVRKHRTEWCAVSKQRKEKYKERVRDHGGCEKTPDTNWEDGADRNWEARHGEKSGPQSRGTGLVQTVYWVMRGTGQDQS